MNKIKNFSVLLRQLFGGGKLTANNSTVSNFELDRFLGDWYEIARFDHPFERGMEHTKARYTLRRDGKVDVLNSGQKNGKYHEAKGVAKLTDMPALLRVSFWGPFYSDYRIMLLDKEYQYALIGGGSDDFLWILSRNPQVSPTVKKLILDEAQRRGYDTENLIWVNQQN